MTSKEKVLNLLWMLTLMLFIVGASSSAYFQLWSANGLGYPDEDTGSLNWSEPILVLNHSDPSIGEAQRFAVKYWRENYSRHGLDEEPELVLTGKAGPNMVVVERGPMLPKARGQQRWTSYGSRIILNNAYNYSDKQPLLNFVVSHEFGHVVGAPVVRNCTDHAPGNYSNLMCEDGFDYPMDGDPLRTSRRSYFLFQVLFFLPALVALAALFLVWRSYTWLE